MSREANLIGYIKRTQNLFNSSVFLHSLNMSVTINLPIIHTAFQINSILNAKWNGIKYEMKSIENLTFLCNGIWYAETVKILTNIDANG